MKRGELHLFEQDSVFHAAIFSVAGKYVLLHGIRVSNIFNILDLLMFQQYKRSIN